MINLDMQTIKTIILIFLFFLFKEITYSQKPNAFIVEDVGLGKKGHSISTSSKFAPFPDTGRAKGHDYNGQYFDFENHYNDSSVLIYVPQKFNLTKPLELVLWFHGWNNNIDSAGAFFRLIEQFEHSGRNAIFIFPEGPKNAPDSYGGKFERPEIFLLFIKDMLRQLVLFNILPQKKKVEINDCSISLSGHSGAYRIISKIIQYNKVDEVILFDAMYGSNEVYLKWIAETDVHRFIHIYTKDGGTFENTHLIMNYLKDSLNVHYISVNEREVNPTLLRSSNRLFIYSDKAHNEVITNSDNNNWQRFLKYRKNKFIRKIIT